MTNLDIYNKVKDVPNEAQKEIKGGRLKGMTDINPMWRIKTLTEQFGPCGIGWYTEITKQWLERETGTNEIVAFININLYVKLEEQWSKPIFGSGGSSFVANESKGLYVSDECFKMAYTDAISVACKALGIGADVYWKADKTKNDLNQDRINSTPSPDEKRIKVINFLLTSNELSQKVLMSYNKGTLEDLTGAEISQIYAAYTQKGYIQ